MYWYTTNQEEFVIIDKLRLYNPGLITTAWHYRAFPDSKDPRFDTDRTSMRRETVRLMFSQCRSEVYYLGLGDTLLTLLSRKCFERRHITCIKHTFTTIFINGQTESRAYQADRLINTLLTPYVLITALNINKVLIKSVDNDVHIWIVCGEVLPCYTLE